MSNYDHIGTLYDTAGKLTAVRYSIYDCEGEGQDWIDAIELRFEDAVASVYADDDDTIRLELSGIIIRENCYTKIATSTDLWKSAIGASPTWIWLLKNQQGYGDGLRFEFSSTQKSDATCVITLIAIASGLQVFVSERVRLSIGNLLPDRVK